MPYYSGIDFDSFKVTADFAVNGMPAGENLASHFRRLEEGVYEMRLKRPIESPREKSIVVSIKDRQGNITWIERTFLVTGRKR